MFFVPVIQNKLQITIALTSIILMLATIIFTVNDHISISRFHCHLLFQHAVTEEEKAAFREVMAPLIAECSEEHGVSDADIQAAKEAGSADAIEPCFLGCVMKKTETVCL